jgi:hypothetical protein
VFVNSEREKTWKEKSAKFWVLTEKMPGGIEEKHEKPLTQI